MFLILASQTQIFLLIGNADLEFYIYPKWESSQVNNYSKMLIFSNLD